MDESMGTINFTPDHVAMVSASTWFKAHPEDTPAEWGEANDKRTALRHQITMDIVKVVNYRLDNALQEIKELNRSESDGYRWAKEQACRIIAKWMLHYELDEVEEE